MKRIGVFHQVRTRSGTEYFIGTLSGMDVCLARTGATDREGNPLWDLVSKKPQAVIRGRQAELLDGGCVLIQLDEMERSSATRARRRSANK